MHRKTSSVKWRPCCPGEMNKIINQMVQKLRKHAQQLCTLYWVEHDDYLAMLGAHMSVSIICKQTEIYNGTKTKSVLVFMFSTSTKLCSADFWLSLNMRGPNYRGLTRPISWLLMPWLLMPWLLTSPGHQQPWYWLCTIGRFLSFLRKDFNYLRPINMEKWHKM